MEIQIQVEEEEEKEEGGDLPQLVQDLDLMIKAGLGLGKGQRGRSSTDLEAGRDNRGLRLPVK